MHQLAAHLHPLAIVFRQIFSQPGNAGVHLGAAQFFLGGDFPGRRLE